ncbi:hypothetical protein Emed_006341 [Eimeria media]
MPHFIGASAAAAAAVCSRGAPEAPSCSSPGRAALRRGPSRPLKGALGGPSQSDNQRGPLMPSRDCAGFTGDKRLVIKRSERAEAATAAAAARAAAGAAAAGTAAAGTAAAAAARAARQSCSSNSSSSSRVSSLKAKQQQQQQQQQHPQRRHEQQQGQQEQGLQQQQQQPQQRHEQQQQQQQQQRGWVHLNGHRQNALSLPDKLLVVKLLTLKRSCEDLIELADPPALPGGPPGGPTSHFVGGPRRDRSVGCMHNALERQQMETGGAAAKETPSRK